MSRITNEHVDALNSATTPEEFMATAERVTQAIGVRLPTIYEVIEGYTRVLKLAMPEDQVFALTGLAGQFTRDAMDENGGINREGDGG